MFAMLHDITHSALCDDLVLRFPVSGLSDGGWHRLALSASTGRLALYVDCSLVESVDWVYQGMGISTDGLLMVGGIVESFETPFEVGSPSSSPSSLHSSPPTMSLFKTPLLCPLCSVPLSFLLLLLSKPPLSSPFSTPLLFFSKSNCSPLLLPVTHFQGDLHQTIMQHKRGSAPQLRVVTLTLGGVPLLLLPSQSDSPCC